MTVVDVDKVGMVVKILSTVTNNTASNQSKCPVLKVFHIDEVGGPRRSRTMV
jgi:hypothetical protein